MSGDPDFEYKYSKQFKTRAAGQLWMGPLKAKGYDNRVLQITANELEFDSSVEADRFMDWQRKKYMPSNKLCSTRRMKMISKYDDR